MKRFLLLAAVCGIAIPATAADPVSTTNGMLVYIGTYTGPKSRGIYVSRFDADTGKLSAPELAAETKNPSFLALNPKQHVLYAAGEIENFEGKHSGSVSAFQFDPGSGKLTLLNQQSSGGAGPCHLAVDKNGNCVLVANYGNGSIALLPIGENGKLGPPSSVVQHRGSSVNPQRQSGPHAHFITADPANRFVLACDLGLDKVQVYRLDSAHAALNLNTRPFASVDPGAGPRHLVFHPDGRAVYVINEMGSSLTVFDWDETGGTLNSIQSVSTLPDSFKGQSTCAEVQIHPSGKFLYASNRGHDSIALFTVEPESHKLKAGGWQSTQGKTPRHFGLDPSGRWLLAENQDSDTIVVFRIDSRTGKLDQAGEPVKVGSPVCVVFAPTSF